MFGGGTKDDIRTVVVTAESDVRVAIASGGTAPADAATDGVTLVVAEYPRAFRLPAGHTLWVRSQSGLARRIDRGLRAALAELDTRRVTCATLAHEPDRDPD